MMELGGEGLEGRADGAGHALDDVLQFMDEDVPVVRRASEMASAAFAEDGRSSCGGAGTDFRRPRRH